MNSDKTFLLGRDKTNGINPFINQSPNSMHKAEMNSLNINISNPLFGKK